MKEKYKRRFIMNIRIFLFIITIFFNYNTVYAYDTNILYYKHLQKNIKVSTHKQEIKVKRSKDSIIRVIYKKAPH